MKKVLFALSLLAHSFVYAQNQTALDSLQKRLSNTTVDSARYQIYLELVDESIKKEDVSESTILQQAIRFSNQYSSNYPEAPTEVLYIIGRSYFNHKKIELSNQYLMQALTEVKKTPDSKLLGNILYQMGYNHQFKNDIENAIPFFEKAITVHEKHNNLKEIARCYNHLGALYRNKGQIRKAITLLNKASLLLQQEEDLILSAAVYNSIGRIYKGQASYDSAYHYYQLCLDYSQKADYQKSIATAYNNLGNIEQSRGNLDQALEHYLNSLAIKEKEANARSLGIAYHNVGSVRYELNIFKEAESDFKKSMDYALQSDFKVLRIHNHRKLGDVARAKNNYPEAIKNHEEAVRLSKEMDFKPGLAENYLNLGRDYLAQNNADIALNFFQKSLDISEAINRKRGISLALTGIAEAYVLLQNRENQGLDNKIPKNLGSIESLLLRSNKIAKETDDLNSTTTSLEALIAFYKKRKNYKKEAFYASQYIEYRDSLFDEQTANALANWQTKYETAEKEKEIILLEKEKQLTEKEKQLLSSRNRFYLLLTIGLFSFLLIGAYLFFQLRRNKGQIESQNQQLQELNATKDKFFGIIAHDIRSPIVALDGVGEQMDFYLKKDKKYKLERLAQRVDATAKHLGNLLDNLLNWALSQQGIIPYKPKTIEVEHAIRHVSSMFQNNADAKNIQIKTDFTPQAFAYADEAALNTILRNLIGNAIKFTPNGGNVWMETKIDNNNIHIKISDNGIGMSEEQVKGLFSLEKKSRKGTAGEKGTGLGLTLVKELVDLNNGSISVSSQTNHGTSFEIILPRQMQ